MSLWKVLSKERHKVEATPVGSFCYYPKHWCTHNNNSSQEIPVVSVIFSVHGALNFFLMLAYRMCLLVGLSSIKLMPQKSQNCASCSHSSMQSIFKITRETLRQYCE